MRNKTFISSMVGIAAAVAVAGSASGQAINGGTSWTGWQTVGRSTDGLTTNTVFDVSAVPAPGAIALLGVAGLVGARRRRA